MTATGGRVVAVSMCLDEADTAEGMLRHLVDEVDHVIVADNGSTDGTREILDQLAKELPLTVLDDPDRAYYQSRKMSQLAERAALEHGAEWIVPTDFDEIWVAHADRIRLALHALDKRIQIVPATLLNHFQTAIDVDDPDPFRAMVWRQHQPAPLPKVAFRYSPGAVVHQGNHGVTLRDAPRKQPDASGVLQVRHFPYRSPGQFLAKARNGAAAYAATDLPATEGAHWRAYGDILDRFGPEGLINVYREHFYFLSPTDSGLIRDAAPYLRWKQAAS